MISDLLSLRKASRVKRYHTETLLIGETVGHHSCNVALILIWLYKHLGIQPRVLRAATLHDMPEVYTGDIPAPVKWEYAELEKHLKIAEQNYWSRLEDQRGGWEDPYRCLTSCERRVIKFADMVDLCFKCLEEKELGNDSLNGMLLRGIVTIQERGEKLPITIKPRANMLINYIRRLYEG